MNDYESYDGEWLGTLLLVILVLLVGTVSFFIGRMNTINKVNLLIEQEMVVSNDKISLENIRLDINRMDGKWEF